MALQAKSLFLYGITIDNTNQNIPFQAVNSGPQLNGVIPFGTYALADLATAISQAMGAADSANTYTVTIDRTVGGGTENRVTIATSGSFLSLLFSSGTNAASSIRDLMSFGHSDLTGATSYQNSATTGVTLEPAWWGANFQPPQVFKKNFGTVNVATDGTKEAITWSVQSFIGVEFQYEAQANVLANWEALIEWMIQQNPFEFTPEISSPSTYYRVTLETSSTDGQGLAFNMKEMLPQFPFYYTTGPLVMRVIGTV